MRRAASLAVLALVLTAPARADVFFLDASRGWASGDGGVVATSDGGRSWTIVARRRGTLNRLQFLDSRNGYALAGDTLYRTRDGGRRWTPLRRRVVGLAYPWLVTSHQQLASIDGGLVAAPASVESACALGGKTIWIASGNRLFVARDGGRIWKLAFIERADPGASRWGPHVACRGTHVWALFTGGAATSHEAYVVAHSADGGRTWTHPLAQVWFHLGQRAQIDAYAGPYALAGGDAFFAGSCDPCDGRGRITLTAGNGRRFRRTTIAPAGGRWVSSIAFADRLHGFVVIASTASGVVLGTSDGGRTWRRLYASALLRPTFS